MLPVHLAYVSADGRPGKALRAQRRDLCGVVAGEPVERG